jgi:hypothetical protein
LRLALAAEQVRDLGRQAPEGLPLGVDEVPAALELTGLCIPGLLHTKKSADQASAEAES